jgi:hypothetical protein
MTMTEIRDEHVAVRTLLSREVFSGRVFGIQRDELVLNEAQEPILREYMSHPGAVVIVALRGDGGEEEILLERQYRHPVRAKLWEVPAGLLDIPGEDPLVGAQRELAEEADLVAQRWDVLLDIFNSPGCSSESIRIFLARELSQTQTPFDREDEEADFEYQWVKLDDAVTAALQGSLHNASTVCAVLATEAARRRGWDLREVSSPWLR